MCQKHIQNNNLKYQAVVISFPTFLIQAKVKKICHIHSKVPLGLPLKCFNIHIKYSPIININITLTLTNLKYCNRGGNKAQKREKENSAWLDKCHQ